MGAVVPTCTFIQEVGQQAAHDCLVADNQDVLLPLQLHDDWLHPLDQVLVGLQSGGGCSLFFIHLIGYQNCHIKYLCILISSKFRANF